MGENAQSNWQDHAQSQERMYPNLDQILENLMPENQSQFLRDFFAGVPTAPPSENQNEGQKSQPNCPNCSGSNTAGGWRAPAFENARPQSSGQHATADYDVTEFFQRLGHKLAMKFVK